MYDRDIVRLLNYVLNIVRKRQFVVGGQGLVCAFIRVSFISSIFLTAIVDLIVGPRRLCLFLCQISRVATPQPLCTASKPLAPAPRPAWGRPRAPCIL